MQAVGTCPGCKKQSSVEVPVEGFLSWAAGTYVRNALPELTEDETRTLVTGWHPECSEFVSLIEDDEPMLMNLALMQED